MHGRCRLRVVISLAPGLYGHPSTLRIVEPRQRMDIGHLLSLTPMKGFGSMCLCALSLHLDLTVAHMGIAVKRGLLLICSLQNAYYVDVDLGTWCGISLT